MDRRAAAPGQERDAPARVRAGPSLAISALWLITAKGTAFVFSFAVPLLLVRQLPVHEFGMYKQVFLVLDTATALLPLGFAMSAFYFFPREPGKKAQMVGNTLLVHLIMGALGGALVAGLPALLATVLNSRDLSVYAPQIGVAVLFAVGASFVEFVAIADGAPAVAALFIAGMQLLRSVLLVAAGGLFGSIHAIVNAAVMYTVLQAAVAVWYVRSHFFGAGWRWDWRLMRSQLAYMLPLTYIGLLWWLQTSVHHYVVSNRFGAAAYALYAVGCFQLPVLGIIQESVGSVVIPRVSDLRRRNETAAIVRLGVRTVRTLAAVAFPLYAFLLVMGQEFIVALFTQQYRASWPIFAINLTLIPLSVIAPACDAVFRACPEHLSFLVRARTVLMAPLLGGLWFAAQHLGLAGVIAVMVGVTVVERAVVALKVSRILRLSWSDLRQFQDVAKLAVAAGAAGLAAGAARHLLLADGRTGTLSSLLAICAVVFACVYTGVALAMRVLTSAEQDAIRRWPGRLSQSAAWRAAMRAPVRLPEQPGPVAPRE